MSQKITKDGLIPCPACGEMISGLAATCPKCGNARRLIERLTRKQTIALVLLFLLPVGFIHPALDGISGIAALAWFVSLGYFLYTFSKGRTK